MFDRAKYPVESKIAELEDMIKNYRDVYKGQQSRLEDASKADVQSNLYSNLLNASNTIGKSIAMGGQTKQVNVPIHWA